MNVLKRRKRATRKLQRWRSQRLVRTSAEAGHLLKIMTEATDRFGVSLRAFTEACSRAVDEWILGTRQTVNVKQ